MDRLEPLELCRIDEDSLLHRSPCTLPAPRSLPTDATRCVPTRYPDTRDQTIPEPAFVPDIRSMLLGDPSRTSATAWTSLPRLDHNIDGQALHELQASVIPCQLTHAMQVPIKLSQPWCPANRTSTNTPTTPRTQ